MNSEDYFNECAQKLQSAITSGTLEEIENAKCDCLYASTNFFEAAMIYVSLEHCGLHFDFGSYTIPKGTILYRIREYKEGTDFSKPSEWDHRLIVR